MSASIQLNSLEDRAAELVALARKAGADHCDCVVARSQSLSLSVREGKLENTDRSESDEFSLRVFCDGRTASVFANQAADMRELCDRAVAMAKVSPKDPHAMLAPKERLATELPDLDLFDANDPSVSAMTNQALQCEEAGLSVGGVTKSMGASAGWGMTGFVLATSNGFSGSYSLSRYSCSAAMIAGEGTSMERDYDYDTATHAEDMQSPEKIGKSAGERVVKRLNPRQVNSGAYPVIFDRRQSNGILMALAGAINGSSVARKTSFLIDNMNDQICRNTINIVCDPLIKRGLGSRPVDGEGVSTAAITFVDNGELKQWVLDCATAHELGLQTNARAVRSGSGTAPSTTNLYMQNGETSLDDMIASLGTGLYLNETIGHGVNMVNGDYSKGAGGFWIENGEIAFPVSEITIAGNLKQMFKSMTPANDLEFKNTTNAPSLLMEGMTIGGK
ncbi:MAG: TldD/PmbA family protein [Rhizobiaceae bacterium]|nr:TldD/PmbA family protein [Rhizobiaceae bacterium]